jgi:hypothetical protein
MSHAHSMDQVHEPDLKSVLQSQLEANGVLDHMRARLRAEMFHAIDKKVCVYGKYVCGCECGYGCLSQSVTHSVTLS